MIRYVVKRSVNGHTVIQYKLQKMYLLGYFNRTIHY